MISLRLDIFWDLAHRLEDFEMHFILGEAVGSSVRDDLQQGLESLFDTCRALNLEIAAKTLARAINDVPTDANQLRIILGVVKDQMSSLLVVHIPEDRAVYFEQDRDWSGVFPTAAFEIRQAGNAYAAGLDTAAVYHCTRALEFGLYALAADTGVVTSRPIDSMSWGQIIDKIPEAIEAKRKAKGGSSSDPKVMFWSDAASQFFIFKEAWRNRTAHVRATYTQDQAKKIWDAVDDFMGHLAKGGLKE